ncbi:MAG: single-stranded-DNA-specific exonuclease RecJ [Desulfobacterales bacterium]|jgi:single-stranded-DNA-specific exonuclease|nr:single-stranded-DNA-specific exonuclease RecJ [Desulfobacterales bacterium]
MEKRWQMLTPDPALVRLLADALGCHPVTATLLANRGLQTPDQAQSFLSPALSRLRPPNDLAGLETAVKRIARALTAREPILVFGDYDVDGATATAVLVEVLSACGAQVSYYIPHRLNEGYGLQPRHVGEVMVPRGARLVITADCGIGSHDAVRAAAQAGIDVIVTDHHTVSGDLPPACAVVNPKRPDCPAGLGHLAGVGVAFCLALALRKHLREMGFWNHRPEPNLKSACDLVALGTIADMVPLVEENRILTRTGLELIRRGRRPGLSALLDAAGIPDRPAEAEDVAFRLGPRLNAAGRIGHAGTAVELLTAASDDEARRIAQTLNALNAHRQEIERGILADIQDTLARRPELLSGRTLVMAHPGWHQGVIGIVASKVMELHYRPVVLISLRDGAGRGSARSIPGIDLYACLHACREHLEDLGGHLQAAGLQIAEERLPAFRRAFEDAVAARSTNRDFQPRLQIDAALELGDITPELIDQIEGLMPYGSGNPEPLFVAHDLIVTSSSWVAQHHRRMVLRPSDGPADRSVRAIHFNADPRSGAMTRFERLAFKLRWNRWNGGHSPQLVVEAAA